jgi:hypothetical protein
MNFLTSYLKACGTGHEINLQDAVGDPEPAVDLTPQVVD